MEPSHLLVGFNPHKGMKAIIEDHLSNLASLTYLSAAEDRTAAIETWL